MEVYPLGRIGHGHFNVFLAPNETLVIVMTTKKGKGIQVDTKKVAEKILLKMGSKVALNPGDWTWEDAETAYQETNILT
jgi:hypothetical protein